MKLRKHTILFLILLGGICQAGNAEAQWKKIASNLVIPFLNNDPVRTLGAIHYKDGIIWAGWWRDTTSRSALLFSNDSGKTWQGSNIPLTDFDIISDICFFDKLNGLVSTYNQGVFLTRDGGLSWNLILTFPFCVNVAFNGSPDIIHALTVGTFPSPPGLLHTSTDGGVSWTFSAPGGYTECFTIATDKTIYVLSSTDPTNGLPGFISFSTDLGNTWQQRSAEVDGDSYTLSSDSCDAKRLYVANEDYRDTYNNLSELFLSSDAGISWKSSISFPTPYFSGGMACTTDAIYASSLNQGIYRSTDQGVTWKKNGGPVSMAYDARNVTCINDNIVFALDEQGSIWETTNSGGDPLSGTGNNDLLLSQNLLFTSDSLLVCDSSTSHFITLNPQGCFPPTISKIEFFGADSLSYTSIPLAGDSIGVNFSPLFDSLNNARLVLTLSDGKQKIVQLTGFGIPKAPLTLISQDQTADTLGGSVRIPITLNGLHRPEDITLVVHYDTVLNYTGSTSNNGTALDLPGEQWKGRSKLKVSGAIPNSIIGFANFEVFNDSVPIQHVMFDSVTVLTAPSICEYISPALALSTVTPVSGCGIMTISKFMHYGRQPDLSIVPNPTSGDASISSTIDLGEVNISVFDMMGKQQSRTTLTLAKNIPARLSLPVPKGVYEVRLSTPSESYHLRIVVNR